MQTWNERLKEALSGSGYSKSGFARAVGVSPPTVTDWLSGEIVDLKAENAEKIRKVLRINLEWLLKGTGPKAANVSDAPTIYPTLTVTSPTVRVTETGAPDRRTYANVEPGPDMRGLVPVISWVRAGAWHEAIDNGQPWDGGEGVIACPWSHGINTYALRVRGDSMTSHYGRSYPEGCLIYVDPDQRGGVVSGDRVIACVEGAREVTFKVFVQEGHRRYLKPLNPQHPLITDPFEVLGKVLGALIE